MEDVILIIAVAAVMVFGFFIMKRLDVFLKENKKAIEKKREEECSPLEFIDSENYENMTCIEKFKKAIKKRQL
jgi:FtsZ-interacting cell division protein ZipA